MAWTFQATGLPPGTWSNDDLVRVDVSPKSYRFTPRRPQGGRPQVVLLPGGLADPAAYAPLCRNVAARGFACHVFRAAWRMPQNDLASLAETFPFAEERYVVGGHSQGGKAAAQFASEDRRPVHGLFLLGTSHPRDVDLSDRDLPTLKIYAEHDGLASVAEVLATRDRMPTNHQLVLVEGGNHSQFGYLGTLIGDGRATRSLEAQQQDTVDALVEFLQSVSAGRPGAAAPH